MTLITILSRTLISALITTITARFRQARANFYREANFETEANFRRKSNFSSEANFRPEANFCNEANFGRPIMTLAPGPGAGNSRAPYLGPGPPGAE